MEELRAIARRGEDQRTEFKAAEADAADIARAIVAMGNSGGSIVVGVGDDGELLGLWYAQPPRITRHIRTMPHLASWRQWVVNVSRHNCEPAVPVSLEHVEAEGRDFLVVHVPDGQDKAYRANGRVYVRLDREVHEATREEIGPLMSESGRVQYERMPVTDAEFSELDDGLVRGYFAEVRHLPYAEDADERARLLVNLGFSPLSTPVGSPPASPVFCSSACDPRTACRPRRSSAPSSTGSTRAPSFATGPM